MKKKWEVVSRMIDAVEQRLGARIYSLEARFAARPKKMARVSFRVSIGSAILGGFVLDGYQVDRLLKGEVISLQADVFGPTVLGQHDSPWAGYDRTALSVNTLRAEMVES